MPKLSRLSAQEFPPGRYVKEEVTHGDASAGRASRVAHFLDPPPGDEQLRSDRLARAAGLQVEPRDRRDGGQGLAPEPECCDALNVVHVADLARGMALDAQQGVVVIHPAPVVGDQQGVPPPRDDFHLHLGGAGIERVLHQFLDDGCGAFDHFPGGDLIDHPVGQDLDLAGLGHTRTIRREGTRDEYFPEG